MREIFDESELPQWVANELDREREYWIKHPIIKETINSTKLGSLGYRVYHIKDNWYVWDCGPSGKLVSDGHKIFIKSYEDQYSEYESDTEVFIGWINIYDLPRLADRIYNDLDADLWPRESIKEIYNLLKEDGLFEHKQDFSNLFVK